MALHFAGRDAEAIAALDEDYRSDVDVNGACLYAILGQTEKAKQIIGKELIAFEADILDDESISEVDVITEQLDDLILELSETPLIDLTEFKQLVQSK